MDDAYEEYIKRRRAKIQEQPEIEAQPKLTEDEANLLIDLVFATEKSLNPGVAAELRKAARKISASLTEAQKRSLP